MICWYCHWGWPKKVADIYLEAVKRLDGNSDCLHYGPSHIVWEDENFHSAQDCLDNFDELLNGLGYSDHQIEVIKWSLVELSKLSPVDYEYPEGYDDENPYLYPPTFEVVKI